MERVEGGGIAESSGDNHQTPHHNPSQKSCRIACQDQDEKPDMFMSCKCNACYYVAILLLV